MPDIEVLMKSLMIIQNEAVWGRVGVAGYLTCRKGIEPFIFHFELR